MSKRKLSIIGSISGLSAMLMLFVLPLIGINFLPDLFNNTQFGVIYFILFLLLTLVGNITLEKSQKDKTTQEERDEKINSVLNPK
jgi:hypothetical protein